MRLYFRVLRYLAPSKYQIVVTIIVSLLASLFSVVSIYMILPLLNTVFNPDSVQTTTVSAQAPTPPPAAQSDTKVPKTPKVKSPEDLLGQYKIDEYKDKLKVFFNNVMRGETKEKTLLNICLFLITSFFLKNLFLYINNQLVERVQSKTAKKLRDDVFAKIIDMPLSYFNQHKVGTLMNYVYNEVSVVHNAISSSFMNFVRNPFMVLLYLIVLIFISWKLTLFALFVSIISLLVIRTIGKKIRRYSNHLQSKMGNMNSRLQEVFNGIKLVKANAMEGRETAGFKDFTNEMRRVNLKVASFRGVIGPLNETLGVSAIAFALWFGGLQVFQGAMSSMELIVFAFALFSTMKPIKSIAEANTKVQEGLGSAARLFTILDTVPDMQNGTKPISEFGHVIRLENVWFRYHKEDDKPEYVLQDLTIDIKKGETVALVGSSGSGKSTLVDLVLRFYDVERGLVTIDGTDIREFDVKQLRRLFGVVSQEVILFNDTIAGNIAYGSAKAVTHDDIVQAAKIANAHEFILNAPEKYETNIGDRGLRLSGGQRQRLSIARAMLKNPPILIFDEATSALDNESEKIVQEAIDNAMQDRTAIVIAHRLSTIKNADKIIVLDKGRVVETGNHFELIAKGGTYKKLYDMQFAKAQGGSNTEVQIEPVAGNS